MARFVRAPDMRDPPELFRPPRDFRFVKSLLREDRLDAFNVTLDVEEKRRQVHVVSAGNCCRRNTTRPGEKQRALSFPIPRFPGGPGNYIVSRVDDGVDRTDIVEIHDGGYHKPWCQRRKVALTLFETKQIGRA